MHADDELDAPLVIIVDDSEAVRSSLAMLLRAKGFDVASFNDGQEALSARLPSWMRCLFIDYDLPVIDGLALLGKLRGRGVTAPAFLITGCVKAGLATEALNTGYRAVLEKPLKIEALLEAVTAT